MRLFLQHVLIIWTTAAVAVAVVLILLNPGGGGCGSRKAATTIVEAGRPPPRRTNKQWIARRLERVVGEWRQQRRRRRHDIVVGCDVDERNRRGTTTTFWTTTKEDNFLDDGPRVLSTCFGRGDDDEEDYDDDLYLGEASATETRVNGVGLPPRGGASATRGDDDDNESYYSISGRRSNTGHNNNNHHPHPEVASLDAPPLLPRDDIDHVGDDDDDDDIDVQNDSFEKGGQEDHQTSTSTTSQNDHPGPPSQPNHFSVHDQHHLYGLGYNPPNVPYNSHVLGGYGQHQQQPSTSSPPQHPYGPPPPSSFQQQTLLQQQQQKQGNRVLPPPPLPPVNNNGDIDDDTQWMEQDLPPLYPPFPMNNNNGAHAATSLLDPWGAGGRDDTTLTGGAGGGRSGGPGEETAMMQSQQDAAQQEQIDLSAFNKEYILKGLARLYRKKILPLELASRYGHFHSPPLSPSDFDAPPTILLLGQYSVGKTSFVKYLLGRDFPGIRVGPEPTTDRFTAVLWGPQDKIVPGAALCSQTHRPFTGLGPFGNNFLSRMEGSELDAPILRNITLIDTPGILSGQKQRARNYDYEAVMKWFAERADLIIIMFDAHKLDISDELKRVMHLMIPHLDKIRIVLNKADSISTQQLMRVYGALMWQLGKVMNTPEVARVYVGSFWDAPFQNTEQRELLQREEYDLLHDIMSLPQQAVMRRINEMVKRARSVKVHAYIIHYLRKQLPYTWGKRDKQKRLIGRLEQEFLAAARRYSLPKGDFPPLEPMRQALYEIKDLSEFPKLDKRLVREMDKVFSVDIPDLLEKARSQ